MSTILKKGRDASYAIAKGVASYIEDVVPEMAALRGVTTNEALGAISSSAGFIGLFKSNEAGNHSGATFSINIENKSSGIVCPSSNFYHWADVHAMNGGCAMLAPGESTRIDFTGNLNQDGDPYCGIGFDVFDKNLVDVSESTKVEICFGSDDNRNNFPPFSYSINDYGFVNFDTDFHTLQCLEVEAKFAIAVMGCQRSANSSAWVANIVVTNLA
ncbi:hypothetical protein THF5G08_230021 [Vibrio jasicida]|uniref:hypothetical protein n=1 Tax=Vibrio jasicida TaxID=766224 RepID=UPI00289475E5|nr:hypothetical protein THF5G08_230021 [Vibrio jasicida]